MEILLPNTKPTVVGTIYRPPELTKFIKVFDENLSKKDAITVDNFNVDMWQNGIMFSKTTIEAQITVVSLHI